MIKVFTTGVGPLTAGDALTKEYNDWVQTLVKKIEIISIHTSSNKYGWMLTVLYKSN